MIVRTKHFCPDPLSETPESEIFDLSDNCFHCGEQLTIPFVYWHRGTESICLHFDCAGRLGGGMFRDFLESRDGKALADDWWKPHRDSFR